MMEPMTAARIEAARMPILASACRASVSNARPVMNNDTVKPIPATAPTPAMWLQRAPAGSRANPSRTAIQLKAVIPISLPATRRDGHADEHARRVGDRVTGQRDAGVGEGEDRHDHIARPRMQRIDQPVTRRDGATDETGCCSNLVNPQVVAVLQEIDDLVGFEVGLHRTSRGQQPEHDAGDGGVHAGLVDDQPQRQPREDDDGRVADASPVHQRHQPVIAAAASSRLGRRPSL